MKKIPVELRTSKLEPRATKLTLVGYFECKSYKLLNYATELVYSARNVIFEKGTMNFTKGVVCIEWNDDDNPMPIYMMTKRLAEV